jgi:hypothetical protein
MRESDPHGQWGYHDFVPKVEETPAVAPSVLRDAATRAAVWGVIAAAAKDRQDEAKAELASLEPGDTVAAKVGGQIVGKATQTKGRSKLAVHDEAAFLEWVKAAHPTEVVEAVNPAFVKSLEARAKELGLGPVIDNQGEVVPGVEIVSGDPYVTVRKEKDAPLLVAQLLSSGRVHLDGIRELEAPKPEPLNRYEQDRQAGGVA